MKVLKTEDLITKGSFFKGETAPFIRDFILQYSDTCFGEEVVLHSFLYPGFEMGFVLEAPQNELNGEQLEIKDPTAVKDDFLLSILSLEQFKENFSQIIEAVYSDDTGEEVVFLRNGVNVHFNKGLLSLITSPNPVTRNLVRNTMAKVN